MKKTISYPFFKAILICLVGLWFTGGLFVPNLQAQGDMCGAIAGIPCPEGQVCNYEDPTCLVADLACTCVIRPDACIEIYDPVCGCDGVTYGNDCMRIMAGATLAYQGECREDVCDDGTPLICDMIPPTCGEMEILAIQNGCWICVNPDTCLPWGVAQCRTDADCPEGQRCDPCGTSSCPYCDDCVPACEPDQPGDVTPPVILSVTTNQGTLGSSVPLDNGTCFAANIANIVWISQDPGCTDDGRGWASRMGVAHTYFSYKQTTDLAWQPEIETVLLKNPGYYGRWSWAYPVVMIGADGDYNVKLSAEDAAGNRSDVIYQIVIDRTDTDEDGTPDCIDNCPAVCNPLQLDADGDGLGDLCDPEPDCGGCMAACEEPCEPACKGHGDIPVYTGPGDDMSIQCCDGLVHRYQN